MNDQIAKVLIIKADKKNIFSWLRSNLDLGIKETKEIIDSGIVDFYGDYDLAVNLYNHLISFPDTKAQLIINVSCDIPTYPQVNCF